MQVIGKLLDATKGKTSKGKDMTKLSISSGDDLMRVNVYATDDYPAEQSLKEYEAKVGETIQYEQGCIGELPILTIQPGNKPRVIGKEKPMPKAVNQ